MGHAYTNHVYHIIFSTKNRLPTLCDDFRDRLYEYMHGIARKEFGAALKFGGTPTHLHAVLNVRPDITYSDAVRKLKCLSSGWVHKTFPGNEDFGWQNGYGSFVVSESILPAVLQYVENQAEHHKTVTFEQEFIEFLERHHIEYDPKYVFD